MAANFDNCTLGGAQVFIDDVDIGYTEGTIEFGRSAELKKLIDGIPQTTVGQVIIKEEFTCKIPSVEITAENLIAAGLNLLVTTVAGDLVAISDGSNTSGTFAINSAYSTVFQSIVLLGPTITGLVVENVAEDTTYDVTDDYILDATNGVIYRNPSGAITSLATVRLTYNYVPVAKKRIKLGVNNPIVNRKIKLVHTSPVSANIITVELWKCLGNGNVPLNFTKEEFFNLNMEFVATPDVTNHSTEPIGYIDIQVV